MIAALIGIFGEAVGFLAACIYLTLKHVTRHCGSQYSRLKPRLYTWLFIGGDFGSIVVQALGGGVAAAGGHAHPKVADIGDKIIIAGIALQLVVMTFAAALISEFYWRLKTKRPIRSKQVEPSPGPTTESEEEKGTASPNATVPQGTNDFVSDKSFRIFCWGIGFAFLTIYIRCIYRIPEMSGGWGGPLMRKENDFYILDGMMCALATIAYTVVHPGIFFPPMRKGWMP
ncbi:putative rta1 domain [Phaeomoniella chlamydospora]|uniref:Putative rta1 domain n=1 Tax=Phaeomoniella chlamydospora TaxID=158046 RepID=A0A0G2GJM8_PHACM|nr:putative rta1 domain [Phaeomoniella chlamydospora]